MKWFWPRTRIILAGRRISRGCERAWCRTRSCAPWNCVRGRRIWRSVPFRRTWCRFWRGGGGGGGWGGGRRAELGVSERAGTNLNYLGFNMEDEIVGKREVRQALAFATDREALIRYLLHGQARIATGILPPNHWAYEANVTQYSLDTARAEVLLDAAGFPRGT